MLCLLKKTEVVDSVDILIMIFKLTEEQLAVRDAARDFAQHELLPGVIERDEKQEFPTEQIKKSRKPLQNQWLSFKLVKASAISLVFN